MKACREAGGNFHQLIELSAGDGKVIEHFSRHLPEIAKFHAIGINAGQVVNNREVYAAQPALHFHHADIRKWIPEHAGPGSVVVVNGGVLEYLIRPELAAMLDHLAKHCSPCVIAITESIAADHDLDHEPATYSYGLELSLSRNYLALLREVGFTVTFTNDRLTTPEESEIVAHWLQVVAYRA